MGVRDPKVLRLREILNVTGDDEFDVALAVLVRGFQLLHGIDPHGDVDEVPAIALGM